MKIAIMVGIGFGLPFVTFEAMAFALALHHLITGSDFLQASGFVLAVSAVSVVIGGMFVGSFFVI